MKNITTMAVIAGVLSITSVANAQSLKYTGTQLSSPNSGTIKANSNTSTVLIGALTFSTGSDSIVTYCADANSPLNNSNNPYTVGNVDLTAGTGMSLAAKILATGFSSATTADQQAGLQLAIWDAIYDNGSSFSSGTGNFSVVSGVSNTVLNYASSYFTAGKNSNPTTAVELFSSQGAGGQSQLHVVPEPASMAVLGLGALGLIRRRRNKK